MELWLGQPEGMHVSMAASRPRTVPVVVEIYQLVTPLRHYSQRVFDECDDDEEAADGGHISAQRQRARSAQREADGASHGLIGSE